MVNEFCNRFEKPHEKKASFYMWVKDKELNVRYLVSGITDHTVMLQNGARPDWNELLQKYSFMDNSPCGVVEKRL